ncbi:MAG: hypothetical protein ACLFUP_02820 [Desulfobacteraceae bacterium]
MDEQEFKRKYVNLRILKSIQEYLKPDKETPTAVYPIRVPDELLYQVAKLQGAENADKLIHHIFELGLGVWSERQYSEVFGSEKNLEEFIELVKDREED